MPYIRYSIHENVGKWSHSFIDSKIKALKYMYFNSEDFFPKEIK